MAENGLTLVGAGNLIRTLRAAGASLADLKALNKAVASTVVAAGRGTAPRRSGRLGASVRAGSTQKAAVIRAGKGTVPYAQPIHWGWGRRHIQAQPWLSHAAQSTEPTWQAQYREGVEQILDSIEGA